MNSKNCCLRKKSYSPFYVLKGSIFQLGKNITQLRNLIDFGELQDLTAIEFSSNILQS